VTESFFVRDMRTAASHIGDDASDPNGRGRSVDSVTSSSATLTHLTKDSDAKLPEELLKRLHQANDRFHESRGRLEKAMDGSDYRHQERVNAAAKELRQAERKVEDIEQEIKKLLMSENGRDSTPPPA